MRLFCSGTLDTGNRSRRSPEADCLGTATHALAEKGIVLSARLSSGGRTILARLKRELGLVQIPFGEARWREAGDAHERLGRRRRRRGTFFPEPGEGGDACPPLRLTSGRGIQPVCGHARGVWECVHNLSEALRTLPATHLVSRKIRNPKKTSAKRANEINSLTWPSTIKKNSWDD